MYFYKSDFISLAIIKKLKLEIVREKKMRKSMFLIVVLATLCFSHPVSAEGICPPTSGEGWDVAVFPPMGENWTNLSMEEDTNPIMQLCINNVLYTVDSPNSESLQIKGLGSLRVQIVPVGKSIKIESVFYSINSVIPTVTSAPIATATVTVTNSPTVSATQIVTNTPIATATQTAIPTNTSAIKVPLPATKPIVFIIIGISFAIATIIFVVVLLTRKK